jgi:hypothetical protein
LAQPDIEEPKEECPHIDNNSSQRRAAHATSRTQPHLAAGIVRIHNRPFIPPPPTPDRKLAFEMLQRSDAAVSVSDQMHIQIIMIQV